MNTWHTSQADHSNELAFPLLAEQGDLVVGVENNDPTGPQLFVFRGPSVLLRVNTPELAGVALCERYLVLRSRTSERWFDFHRGRYCPPPVRPGPEVLLIDLLDPLPAQSPAASHTHRAILASHRPWRLKACTTDEQRALLLHLQSGPDRSLPDLLLLASGPLFPEVKSALADWADEDRHGPAGLDWQRADPRWALLPSTTIIIDDATEADIETLVSNNWLPPVTELGFQRATLSPDDIAKLADWPGLASVRALTINRARLKNDDLIRLCASPHLESCVALSLRSNRLSDACVPTLLGMRLTRLDGRTNAFTRDAVVRLTEGIAEVTLYGQTPPYRPTNTDGRAKGLPTEALISAIQPVIHLLVEGHYGKLSALGNITPQARASAARFINPEAHFGGSARDCTDRRNGGRLSVVGSGRVRKAEMCIRVDDGPFPGPDLLVTMNLAAKAPDWSAIQVMITSVQRVTFQ